LTGRVLGVGHRALEVVCVGDQRPLADVDARLVAAEYPDRHAVVVPAPAARGLEGSPAGDDRPRVLELVEHLSVDGHLAVEGPLVQASPAVAEPVARARIGAGDESVERHRHVENGCGHGGSSSRLWDLACGSRPLTRETGWFDNLPPN